MKEIIDRLNKSLEEVKKKTVIRQGKRVKIPVSKPGYKVVDDKYVKVSSGEKRNRSKSQKKAAKKKRSKQKQISRKRARSNRKRESIIREGWQYSKDFQHMMDMPIHKIDDQVLMAKEMADRLNMNPESIYNWANQFNVDLIKNAHILVRDYRNFIKCIMAKKPYTGELKESWQYDYTECENCNEYGNCYGTESHYGMMEACKTKKIENAINFKSKKLFENYISNIQDAEIVEELNEYDLPGIDFEDIEDYDIEIDAVIISAKDSPYYILCVISEDGSEYYQSDDGEELYNFTIDIMTSYAENEIWEEMMEDEIEQEYDFTNSYGIGELGMMDESQKIKNEIVRLKENFKLNESSASLNAIPNKEGITELNILQILALNIIRAYRTNRIKSFLGKIQYNDPRYFDQNEKKKELNYYLDIINSDDASVLWDYILNELSKMGFVKNKAITNSGYKELQKIFDYYNVPDMI